MIHIKKFENSRFKELESDIIDILKELKDEYPDIDGHIISHNDYSEIIIDVSKIYTYTEKSNSSLEFIKFKNEFNSLLVKICERFQSAFDKKVCIFDIFDWGKFMIIIELEFLLWTNKSYFYKKKYERK